MTPEMIKFLHQVIHLRNVDVLHSDTEAEYTIEMDDGTEFTFACVYTNDNHGRPGRYYVVTMNTQVIADGFCLENDSPSEITRTIMELVRHCSNKVLTQEMKSRQNGLLKQLESNKVHS